MKIGIPTLVEFSDVEDHFRLAGQVNADFVELNMNLPYFSRQQIDVSRIRDLCRQYRVGVTLHLDENCNPFDFDPEVARCYTQVVLDAMDLAHRLGVPLVNLHLPRGVYFTLPDRKIFLFDRYRELFLSSIRAFRATCESKYAITPVTVCMENTKWYDVPVLGDAIDLLCQSPAFGLTFDVGHNAACGGDDFPIIQRNIRSLRHFHLHHAQDGKDHLPLKTDTLNLDTYLNLAEHHNCSVVIEVKTSEDLIQSFEAIESIRK